MTKRTNATQPQHARTHKPATLTHHHAKPYRKRHVSALGAFVLTALLLILFVFSYQAQLSRGFIEAQSFVASLFNAPNTTPAVISSTYGYSLSYDSRLFYATGIDAATGDIFVSNQLSTKRAYDTVRISPTSNQAASSPSSFKFRFLDATKATGLADPAMKNLDRTTVVAGIDLTATDVTQEASSVTRLGGQEFLHTDWQLRAKTGPATLLPAYATTYIGVINGRAVTILINNGINSSASTYGSVLQSLQFGDRIQAAIPATTTLTAKTASSTDLLDTVLMAGVAQAAAAQKVDDLERNTSIYSPAVVKIYNAYCTDVLINGKGYITNFCSAGTGSGFFISGDGYVATNGHVATSSLKDIVIEDALSTLAAGKNQYFNLIANLAGIKATDFNSSMSNIDILDIAVTKMYAIPDSTFTSSKNVHNMFVALGDKEPDITELLTLTKGYKKYTEQDTIKSAELVDANYHAIDGFKSYKASDVAIIKIAGNDYPVAKLGSIDGLIQGANIAILGFPANATNNGIVSGDQSKVTVTAGKVSGIKNANGSDNKLIETDTTIGHGNSGGPALDTNGSVVGIATYTSDGSGKGDGTFNYIRDIKDLKDLATKVKVSYGTVSASQAEWEKGIAAFYNSHYKSAIKSFTKVKSLYAAHPKADEFIAAANDHIKKGDDVPDFPLVLVIVLALVVLAGGGVTVFLIIRHKKLHGVYSAGVASGTIAPMMAGAAPVAVAMPQGVPMAMQPSAPTMPAPAAPVTPTVPAMITPAPAAVAVPATTPMTSTTTPSTVIMPTPVAEPAPQSATPPTASGTPSPVDGGPPSPIS